MATRREFIGGIGALLGAVGCGSQRDREPRMNVLFLFPDQMRAQATAPS
ncbi:MAG: twin-arginine translocation signal domain-containing protein, partial [Acidobacteriia bacterium]|nr:twin-arginine translocation signal domain-containing protein [Terriglobia bacterium]